MHLGHAFSAITAFDAARAAGGRFLLRIEDIDQSRCRPEFEAAIFDDLSWLGLAWETPVRRQSEHFADYQTPLQRLIEAGLAFRCFATRKEMALSAPHGPEVSPFFGARLNAEAEREKLDRGAAFAWRLDVRSAAARAGPLTLTDETGAVPANPVALGDVVLARKDAPASYHLASVWDDALQGVTHVIRGEDLRQAAHLHRLLQQLLDLPPPIYQHHRLVLGPDGKRLAKRDHAASLKSLRNSGVAPEDVRALLGLK